MRLRGDMAWLVLSMAVFERLAGKCWSGCSDVLLFTRHLPLYISSMAPYGERFTARMMNKELYSVSAVLPVISYMAKCCTLHGSSSKAVIFLLVLMY